AADRVARDDDAVDGGAGVAALDGAPLLAPCDVGVVLDEDVLDELRSDVGFKIPRQIAASPEAVGLDGDVLPADDGEAISSGIDNCIVVCPIVLTARCVF